MTQTRDDILRRLDRERLALVDAYRAMDEATLTKRCTPSEDPDGEPWSPKDHLAHLLRIEEAFLAMAKRTLDGRPSGVNFSGTSRDEAIARVHRDNETHVASLRDRSLDELLAELDAAREQTVAFIAGLSDEQLETKIPGAPWGDGTIGGVLQANAFHERQHLAWAQEGLGQA